MRCDVCCGDASEWVAAGMGMAMKVGAATQCSFGLDRVIFPLRAAMLGP